MRTTIFQVFSGYLFLITPSLSANTVRLEALNPPIIKRIDRAAEQYKLPTVKHQSVDFGGNAIAWLLSRVVLSAEQERNLADRLHKSLLEEIQRANCPEHISEVWKQLVKQLPPHMKPKPFRYQLTVLKHPEPRLQALGGGRVTITTGLLSKFENNPRADAALAFLLAREIGHIGYEHCRRGWQLHTLQKEVRKKLTPFFVFPKVAQRLETTIQTSGQLIQFLYSRVQEYEVDLFAWQLCRNADFPTEGTLDGMRFLVAIRFPELLTDEGYRPHKAPRPSVLSYYLSTDPNPLGRLKQLLMERDGRVEKAKTFGLFRFDAHREELVRCEKKSIPSNSRAVVLVHGLRGDKRSMREHLEFLHDQQPMHNRPLLIFRYPSNESLAKCGKYLDREMKRVFDDASDVDFVAYSAGGLIFRYYAEVQRGLFRKAVLLGTPHLGSSLTELKFFLDMGYFIKDAQLGLLSAIAKTLPEGRGAVVHDLHPDSLFLRYLGYDKNLAKRYHVIYGAYFGSFRRFAVRTTLSVAKKLLTEHLDHIDSPFARRQAEDFLTNLKVPNEILYGDLVVTTDSARLKGAGRVTATRLHHIDLKKDEFVKKKVLETLTESD